MDFFESQDQARRKTVRLIFLYFLAVSLIVLSIYFVALFVSDFAGLELTRDHAAWHPEVFLAVSLATLAVIFLGSAYRIVQLRGGGSRVAEMMGGRRVTPGTTDPDEQRFVNVVQEMAIASGVPMPEIFIMDEEEGINAFAAGYSPSDAAVAVTRGCLQKLNRDELQGVIAHEFSHILNGDMRLNIRLIGILNGILVLHLMGFLAVRSLRFSAMTRTRSSNGKGGGGGVIVVILILGFALMVIGYIGVLCSRMIQAAVSRQREFLADAAAVQFTRNPEGIGGALKKIGGASHGSQVQASHAVETSHMFFANGMTSALSNAFATHPPLADRIRAIDPTFDGKSWVRPSKSTSRKPPPMPKKKSAEKRSPFEPITKSFPMSPEALLATIGTLGAENISYAGQILQQLPEPLKEAARDAIGAEAIIYSLLLSREPKLQKEQLALIPEASSPGIGREVKRIQATVAELPTRTRLPLVDLAIPALRQLSVGQFQHFRQTVAKLIASDNQLSLFEFSLEKVLMRHLENHFQQSARPTTQYYAPNAVAAEFSLLLSALSHAGDKNTRRAFAAGQARIPELQLRFSPPEQCSLQQIDQALAKLDLASYPVKKRFLDAALAVVISDGKIAADEGELIRALADSIDCPMPPLPVTSATA
jgi:Zn-dependent protease with chaperone function